MTKKAGFSVIEFLCYTAISLGLVYLLSTVTMTIYTTGIKQGYSHMQVGDLYGTVLLLAHDIAQAPPEQLWHEMGPQLMVWRKGDKDCGWLFKDESLFRIQGMYDREAKKFSSSRKTLMARGFKIARFDRIPDTQGLLIQGQFVFKRGAHEQEIKLLFSPRNKQLSYS